LEQKNRSPILIVEDIEEITLHMRRARIQRGYEVISAPNATEAIQIAERISPSMILTDLDLPTFDVLVELVSEHRELSELPVAVIDINHPEVNHRRVKILPDFDALDSLLNSLPSSSSQS
jgi:DNA-binding response OmpR family regulator